MVQAVADTFTQQWIEGQVSRTSPLVDATLSNEDATISKITYVQLKGTDPRRQGKKPVAPFLFDAFSGIIIHAQGIKEKELSTGLIDIEQGRAFTVLRQGFMVVRTTQSVAYDGQVFFVHTAGGSSPQFTFRGDADSNRASRIPAIYRQAGGPTDLVEIYVDFTMKIVSGDIGI